MLLDVTVAWLRVRKGLGPLEASHARTFFSARFPQNPMLHRRKGQESVFAYPRVQFKSLGHSLLVVGLQEGAGFVEEHCAVPELTLGSRKLKVWQCLVQRREEQFGPTEERVLYRFLTPWLALNKENYRAYKEHDAIDARMELLGRVLVGNILSAARSLGLDVEHRLGAEVVLNELGVTLRGEPMTGFTGNFSTNFAIPDYVGLGAGAGRGFGTVRRRE
jgi:hypothetical protein